MEAVHKVKYKKNVKKASIEDSKSIGRNDVQFNSLFCQTEDSSEPTEMEKLLKNTDFPKVHEGVANISLSASSEFSKLADFDPKNGNCKVQFNPSTNTLSEPVIVQGKRLFHGDNIISTQKSGVFEHSDPFTASSVKLNFVDEKKSVSESELNFGEHTSSDFGQNIVFTPAGEHFPEGSDEEYEQLSRLFLAVEEMIPFTENQLTSLYRNEELETNSTFINWFVDEELRGGSVLRHPLYELLIKYLRARERQTATETEIQSLLNESDELQQRLWNLELATITEMGECQDGNPVEATHEYQIGKFDRNLLNRLSKCLARIRELTYEQHSLNTYTCQVSQLRIDQFIFEVCQKFSNLPYNALIGLVSEHVGQQTSDLRSAISVLFNFQRRPCKDQGFVADTRQWLTKLVAVLLRVASWHDHMFLLNHVLRCPPGIDKWAVNYVQSPPAPFNAVNPSQYLNHAMTVLATIISSIKDRESFMASFEKKDGEIDDLWVMVDSDGEDEGVPGTQMKLRENDIISLLNQVPFDYLFSQVIQFSKRDDNYLYTPLSSSQVLRTFAMLRVLLVVFGQGLIHYDTGRHEQFIKRLASLVHHCAHYTTDVWEAFRRDNNECHDNSLIERLQVEYDYILHNACQCLLATKHKSTAQFVAVLPYSVVSLPMLWKLFHMILQPHQDKPGACMNAVQWWDGVEELVSTLKEAELYYLLTAANNMALARSSNDDYLFVKMVTSHLLQIGILNPSTREICYKIVRTLLGNLCNKHPPLISLILGKLKSTISRAKHLSLYLFKELPLDLWKPTTEDMNLLESWLLVCPFGSVEGSVARYILSNMNWGPDPKCENELFLNRDLHCSVAVLITRVAILHCSESPNTSSTAAVTECVKQFAASISQVQTPEQSLSLWAWQLLFKLHLHLMDQSDTAVWSVLNNPSEHFTSLPSMEALPKELSHLLAALRDKQVTAIYVALSITSEGHSIPLICNNGFSIMLSLVQCHRYFAVLVLLQHIVPLFLDCPQSILTSLRFQDLITSLLIADKTFVKLAKNLIMPEYPGIILKQFGDMIQTHLEHFRRYNLSSPAALVQLWLEILCKVWPSEPTNTAYLMDIILRVAYIRPEIKNSCSDILSQLLQAVPALSKPKFSLSSWMLPNTPVMSLMPRTMPDTPWFALFALELEQYFIQTKNGLWSHLLLELSSSKSKSSIDSSLKKVCNSLKLGVISSSSLPIYRWAQQALETPVGHPALPILWQKFFTLYLAKVPGGKDVGSVGAKFFEGMSNLSFLKKLKRKIKDCKEFYENKCANSALQPTSDKKQWLDNVVKLYTSFGLWLEEPRIQEAGIYLPAFPPQYDSIKLNSIFQGDENPWYEFLDYEMVWKGQKENVLHWEHNLSRKIDRAIRYPVPMPEIDPVMRIIKRLQSYDIPLAPPALRVPQQVVPQLSQNSIYNKSLVLENMKTALKSILLFAETFNLYSAEQLSLDCTLMEILPLLYRSVKNEVKLYAACDTRKPRTRNPSPDSLICAGPAVIRIEICESRISEITDVAIHNNRTEMKTCLKRSLQPPALCVSTGSFHVEYLVRAMEREWKDLAIVGDVQLLNSLQEVGVELFYCMTSTFSDRTAAYPPLKQLITTCVEILGQCFISGDERQAGVLLQTVLEKPSLSSLIATHFSPIITSPQMFIQLYKMLMNAPNSVSLDLIFVLLTKFEMGQWLESQKPRLSDHCQLIEIVTAGLAKAGQNPPTESVMSYEVLRRHFCVLMMHDAPLHYGKAISEVLKQTESHSISSDIWYDIINVITVIPGAKFRPHMSLAQVVAETAKFATEQTLISHHEICELSVQLTEYFTKERLQYGLYGLYPKYRSYVSPFTSLLSILGHAAVVTTTKAHGNILPDRVCELAWPIVSGLYSPWLCPYFTQSLTQPTAAWIQQLTDDRSVLLPWIIGDAGHAHKMAAVFTETIRFLIETIPGTGNEIFSYVWQYYVANFAHSSVKEHILSVIHSNFLSLPWVLFSPSLYDVDLMLKVSDSYVPYCHTLLGGIFIDIKWLSWLHKVNCDSTTSTRIHNALLHLFIKLANEPNVRQSSKIVSLLEDAKTFHWETIDSTIYESVVNWFVMSYDPRVVLKLEVGSEVDNSVLELLKMAAGFVIGASGYHSSTTRKRQIYVRAFIKLLISSNSRHKNILNENREKVECAICYMLSEIDLIVSTTGGNFSEAGLLVAELLTIMNLPEGSVLTSIALNTMLKWISARGNCIVISALLRTLGTTVTNNEILGTLMEASLTAFFSDCNSGDWDKAKSLLQEVVPRHPPLEESLVANCHLLTLYAILIKKIPTICDLHEEASILNHLVHYISTVKPSECVEPKIVPLLHLSLWLCSRQCDHNSEIVHNLFKLIDVANIWADFRSPWGILGAIGIRKQSTLSNRCRVLCRSMALIILCQLPEHKGELIVDSQFIRTHPHSPGGLTCNNMELGPGAETIKTLSQLEALVADKNFNDIKLTVKHALAQAKQPENSMHNAHDIFIDIATQLYNERFIMILKNN